MPLAFTGIFIFWHILAFPKIISDIKDICNLFKSFMGYKGQICAFIV